MRPTPHAALALLGGLDADTFLARHWQKKPLLIRQAVPGFGGFLTPQELARLAGRSDAQARIVTEQVKKGTSRYRIDEGPFPGLEIARTPQRHFTLLVQGIEQHLDQGWELLRQFSFVPRARIDDLMVSYAAPGAGVGPHFDLYDVFLLQGSGRRRWRISTDPALCKGDVHQLPPFRPTDDWMLEPGDMLYLPPRVAHWGTADDDPRAPPCTTYSIGFLAPQHEQLVQNFLAFLSQELKPRGMYEDPDLKAVTHPGELDDAMLVRMEAGLAAVRTDRALFEEFVGRWLTGPKPTTRITKPRQPLDRAPFLEACARGLVLTRPSRMLVRADRVFLNGEMFVIDARDRDAFLALADARAVDAPRLTPPAQAMVFEWYRRGFVAPRRSP